MLYLTEKQETQSLNVLPYQETTNTNSTCFTLQRKNKYKLYLTEKQQIQTLPYRETRNTIATCFILAGYNKYNIYMLYLRQK